jgi:hypothetical protein
MRFSKLGAMTLTLTVTACGGPSVADLLDNEVTLTLSGNSSEPERVAVGEAKGGVGVSRALLRASSITLGACSDAADIVLGARSYDLLADDAPFETVSTAVTELCSIQVALDPTQQNAVDDVPEQATVLVEGEDATGAAFQLSSERSFSLRFDAEGGGVFEQPLLLSIDLAKWLAELPQPEENEEMAQELFEAQLTPAAALYSDTNGNHLLDEDETTPLAVAEAR